MMHVSRRKRRRIDPASETLLLTMVYALRNIGLRFRTGEVLAGKELSRVETKQWMLEGFPCPTK